MLENNLIECYEKNVVFHPTASDIFASDDFEIEGISVSRLKALQFVIKFEMFDGQIVLNAYATKKEIEVKLPVINNIFVDYSIINSVLYYVNPAINDVNSIISANTKDIKNLSFTDYVKMSKIFIENDISFIDDINLKIKSIQNIDSSRHEVDILYDYQKRGVNWLTYMFDIQCGCILADSMGLGKTIQIIFLFKYICQKQNAAISLVVAPVSLIENWKREFEKFCPSLNVLVNYGEGRINYYKDLYKYDVVITSYGTIQTGFATYQMINWDAIVLDEAQNIKNPYAKRTQIVKMLPKKIGVAVSGTPFENHLTDIWSIVDFVVPNYFGTLSVFEKKYQDDFSSATNIERFLSPIMLRRKVEEVAKDLPSRVDIPQPIKMSLQEARYYDDGLKSLSSLQSLNLDKIQKLRMFCSHPAVYDNELVFQDPTAISQKYERCCEIVEEIVVNKEKVLIFTSFTKMINLMVDDFAKRFNVPVDFINGNVSTFDRQSKIDIFSKINGAAILVLNPKAAGTGLNITAANHVIHYNLEWNPAIEDQASARAYRRGQTRPVFIHRLYYENTIEEIINEKIERKRIISNIAVVGNDGDLDKLDMIKALSVSPLKEE